MSETNQDLWTDSRCTLKEFVGNNDRCSLHATKISRNDTITYSRA